MIPFLASRCLNLSACSFLQKKKDEKHKQKRVPLYQFIFDSLIEGVSFASYISTFYPCNVFLKMAWKEKKTDTVSLKLPNMQCIKMFNSNSSHSRIYEKSSSKMCVSEKKVCPEGFLGNVSFGEKNVYKFANKQMSRSKTWLRSRKDVKLNFLLCSHSRIYEKSSSKMCVSEKKVCPEGFLGNVSFGEKNVYKFANKQMSRSKTWLRSRKDVKLNFLLCSLPIFFFIFSILC